MSQAYALSVAIPVEGPQARTAVKPTPGMPTPFECLCRRVDYDHVTAFPDLDGRYIQCRAGALWVTVENDPMDHVLQRAEAFQVPRHGKVVIGGKGCFSLRCC